MTELTIDRIIRHEGYSSHVYLDSKGYLSIGYGTTVGKVAASVEKLIRDFPGQLHSKGVGLTKQQARGLVEDRLSKIEIELLKAQPVLAKLDFARDGVVIEMAYQLGVAGLLKFKRMWAALGSEDYELAADEMLDSDWAKQTRERAEELAAIMRSGAA